MKPFFDLLISIFLAATVLPAVILLLNLKRKETWENRHKKITLVISTLFLIASLIIVYGSFIEPQIITINSQKIKLANLSKPIKIAFIADFQVGPYKRQKFVQRVVDKILEKKPDIVLIGGDQVNNDGGTLEDETFYLKPLARLAKQIPTYAINGNHEYGVNEGEVFYNTKKRLPDVSKQVKNSMEKLGIHYLTNELDKLTVNSSSFYLFGGDDYWSGNLNYSALKKRTENLPTIALIHEPESVFEAAGYEVNLLLSGHTHGGQIRLPLIGPLGRVDSYIPLDWYKGLHDYKNTKLFVTSGIGETAVRARLFNPPEVVILNLTPQ